MAITIHTTHRGGTDTTPISGRAPFPVVIDAGSGTASTHTYTASDGGVGIRFDENKWTGVSYLRNSGTTRYLFKTNLASLFSFEKVSLGTLPLLTDATWTVSLADVGSLYHVGTGVHGKPIAVRLNGTVIPEGTGGALANEQWAWGDFDTIGSNRIYVQSILSTPAVECIYGDGTHLRISSVTGSLSIGWEEVHSIVDKDTIRLNDDIFGSDLSDVIVYQNVNPFLNLEYKWAVTPITSVETINNGDQRPGAGSTTIDSSKGYGPVWAFVFKEGFSTATIALIVNDHTNGDTEATSSLVVNETSWSGATNYYADYTLGNDTTGNGSIGTPWKTWTKLINELRTVTGGTPKRGFLKAGETFTETVQPNNWSSETDDTLITSYGSGAKPEIVTTGTASAGTGMHFRCSGPSSNIRIQGLNFTHNTGAGASRCITMDATNSLVINCSVTNNSSEYVMTGGYNDFVLWDVNVLVNVPAAAAYCLYDAGPTEAANERRAIMGCEMLANSSQMCIRTYSTKSIIAYNKLRTESSSGGPALRLAPPFENQRYVSIMYNHLSIGTGGPGSGIQFFQQTPADLHYDTLIEGNFIQDDATAAGTDSAINAGGLVSGILVRNNTFLGWDYEVSANSGGGSMEIMLFNNSIYSNKTGTEAHRITNTSSTPSFRNLKLINNAVSVPNSDTGSIIVQNTGTFGTVESTQILQNVIDFGTVTNAWQIEGSSGGFTEAGWPAQTNKSAQLNYSGNQGKDNDPLFTNAPVGNFLPTDLSPCAGNMYLQSSIKRDYRGYVPESGARNTIGAIQIGGINPDTGSGGSGGMDMTALAARFRCVGLRR